VAWMRMMGADSVEYHEANVANRADDHAGAALDYYGSRGETPLVWGGSGAHLLGVEGAATAEAYRAVFGPGGACLPRTGARLVSTRRPGIELVVSPHKSVAELGVLGWADAMHAIVDTERDATLAYLDRMCRDMGGRRGENATATRTTGLVWVTSRHATTRAGDPQVHDHVLIANVVWMRDERAGWKALDTAFVRDQLHAATAIGRMAAARKAVELGFAIEPDAGRSGRLGSWRITGIPDEALAVHAKRSAQIDELVGADASAQARSVAAHTHRRPKRHQSVEELIGRWRAELSDAGHPPSQLVADIQAAARHRDPVLDRLDDETTANLVAETLGAGSRLAEVKVFDRADVIVAVASRLHGLPVPELDRVVDAVLGAQDCVPLIGVAGARTQTYATAGVLAAEAHIATLAAELAARPAARIDVGAARRAIFTAEEHLGAPMNSGQADAAERLLTSGAGLDLLVGVAGSGKTTTLSAARAGFETAGFTVVGAATSGQAARGLGEGAGIGDSRTIASLGWRLDHDQLRLTDRHVLIIDEGGMTSDVDFGRLLAAAQASGAKIIIAGDDRQLGAIGPGGGMGALLRRHPERISQLKENVRQLDPAEREALAELRAGDVEAALAWYASNDRIRPAPTAEEAIAAAVAGWAADVADGCDTVLVAWRRQSVDDLNAEARAAWARMGQLIGPELEAPGGRRYRAGDLVVMLAPGPRGAWVTSERARITAVWTSTGHIDAIGADGRRIRLAPEETGADRLTHSYAMTAHRTQGATVDTAHVLADGGGRELAYVAMSRARNRTQLYVAAIPDEAAERVGWSWGTERRQHWAHDQGQPQPKVTLARVRRERELLDDIARRGVEEDLSQAEHNLKVLDEDLAHLHAGTGRWQSTPAGVAAGALTAARARRVQAERKAAEPHLGMFQRRRAARDLADAARTLDAARLAWQGHGQLEADRLGVTRAELVGRLNVLTDADAARQAWFHARPHLAEHKRRLDDQLAAPQRLGTQQIAFIAPSAVSYDDIDIGL